MDDVLVRLANRIDFSGDCWIWTACTKPNGYGQFNRNEYAHRVVYETVVAPIDGGMVIDHLCCNKRCVNPDHLEVVTQAENNRRHRLSREKKTQCEHGHAFTPGNTITRPITGARNCRRCKNEQRMQSYYAAKQTPAPGGQA